MKFHLVILKKLAISFTKKTKFRVPYKACGDIIFILILILQRIVKCF